MNAGSDVRARTGLNAVLTYAELAELARESVRTIKRRVHDGKIKVVYLSDHQPRITAEEAAKYLSGRAGSPDAPAKVTVLRSTHQKRNEGRRRE